VRGAVRSHARRSAARRVGDGEDEFPAFRGHDNPRPAREAVLLEPAAGEAEVWDGGLAASGAGGGAEEGGDAQFAGFAGAASGAGAVRFHRRSGRRLGAHGGVLQQGSWACSASGQARAVAKPGMAAESSGASALAMASSSRARAWLTVVCCCSAL